MSFNTNPEPTARQYPVHYRITISGTPDGGFVDHLSSTYYANEDDLADTAASLDLERSNMRYEALVRALSEYATIALTAYDTQTGEDTVYGVTVVYDRPDYVYAYNEDGDLITDPEEAIAFQVNKALSADITQMRTILVPSIVTPDAGDPYTAYTHSTELVTASALTANITVELLDLIKFEEPQA